MGLEAHCRVRFEGQESDGDARLESADLLFRGRFRLRIPFDRIRSAEAVPPSRGMAGNAWRCSISAATPSAGR